MVQSISDSSRSFFSSNTNVKVFGSFATNDICTFASDVDMALWGAFEQEQDEQDGNDEGERKISATNGRNSRKEDKVKRWKEALDELHAIEQSNDDLVHQQQQRKLW
jgi:hypothetical protein